MSAYEPWSTTEVRREYFLIGEHYVRADLIESWTQRKADDGGVVLVVATQTGGIYESPGESMAEFAKRMTDANP